MKKKKLFFFKKFLFLLYFFYCYHFLVQAYNSCRKFFHCKYRAFPFFGYSLSGGVKKFFLLLFFFKKNNKFIFPKKKCWFFWKIRNRPAFFDQTFLQKKVLLVLPESSKLVYYRGNKNKQVSQFGILL